MKLHAGSAGTNPEVNKQPAVSVDGFSPKPLQTAHENLAGVVSLFSSDTSTFRDSLVCPSSSTQPVFYNQSRYDWPIGAASYFFKD